MKIFPPTGRHRLTVSCPLCDAHIISLYPPPTQLEIGSGLTKSHKSKQSDFLSPLSGESDMLTLYILTLYSGHHIF